MFVFASATLVVLSVALAAKKTMVMGTSVNVVNDVLSSYSSVSSINNFLARFFARFFARFMIAMRIICTFLGYKTDNS